MKKIFFATVCAMMIGVGTISADEVMKKQADGTYVVNTKTLCKARGYKSTTPLEVHIKSGKVVKVVALPNQETRSYFAKVKKNLLPKFEGTKVAKAEKLADKAKVDGCTGATFSTQAVQKNVKAALDYYNKNK